MRVAVRPHAKVADGVADNVLQQEMVYRIVAVELKSPQLVVYPQKGEGPEVSGYSYRCVGDVAEGLRVGELVAVPTARLPALGVQSDRQSVFAASAPYKIMVVAFGNDAVWVAVARRLVRGRLLPLKATN